MPCPVRVPWTFTFPFVVSVFPLVTVTIFPALIVSAVHGGVRGDGGRARVDLEVVVGGSLRMRVAEMIADPCWESKALLKLMLLALSPRMIAPLLPMG